MHYTPPFCLQHFKRSTCIHERFSSPAPGSPAHFVGARRVTQQRGRLVVRSPPAQIALDGGHRDGDRLVGVGGRGGPKPEGELDELAGQDGGARQNAEADWSNEESNALIK